MMKRHFANELRGGYGTIRTPNWFNRNSCINKFRSSSLFTLHTVRKLIIIKYNSTQARSTLMSHLYFVPVFLFQFWSIEIYTKTKKIDTFHHLYHSNKLFGTVNDKGRVSTSFRRNMAPTELPKWVERKILLPLESPSKPLLVFELNFEYDPSYFDRPYSDRPSVARTASPTIP
jgi:hypothetical protein